MLPAAIDFEPENDDLDPENPETFLQELADKEILPETVQIAENELPDETGPETPVYPKITLSPPQKQKILHLPGKMMVSSPNLI